MKSSRRLKCQLDISEHWKNIFFILKNRSSTIDYLNSQNLPTCLRYLKSPWRNWGCLTNHVKRITLLDLTCPENSEKRWFAKSSNFVVSFHIAQVKEKCLPTITFLMSSSTYCFIRTYSAAAKNVLFREFDLNIIIESWVSLPVSACDRLVCYVLWLCQGRR